MTTLAFRGGGHGADGGGAPGAAELYRVRTVRTGLWILLGVISALFLLFLLAYVARAQFPDWRGLSDPGAPLSDLGALWINTALLAGAGLSLQRSLNAMHRAEHAVFRHSFLLGGLFAAGFLAGQLVVWERFVITGFPVHGNPANGFFFMLTGLHGLHLAAGLVVWAVIAARVVRGIPLHWLTVECCTRYWHFLFALWLLLFLALTRSPATYAWLAELCGLR